MSAQPYHSNHGYSVEHGVVRISTQADRHDIALTAWAIQHDREWVFEDATAEELAKAQDDVGCILTGFF